MTDVDTDFDPDDYEDPEPRLPKGYLTLDVYNVCKRYVDKEFTLDEGKFMTPYVVMKILMEDTPERKKTSTGAIDAIFKRWEAAGFAVVRQNPSAFVSFTPEATELGLQKFFSKERRKAAKS